MAEVEFKVEVVDSEVMGVTGVEEDLFFAAEDAEAGEYLDRVLVLTVSQPSSSTASFLKLEAVFKSSTDLGVLRPLTVSAQDL